MTKFKVDSWVSDARLLIGFSWIIFDWMLGCCEHINKPSGSINKPSIFRTQSDSQVVKRDSASWSPLDFLYSTSSRGLRNGPIPLQWRTSHCACLDVMWVNFTFMWLYIVTNFFIIRPTRCINFADLFWAWNSACGWLLHSFLTSSLGGSMQSPSRPGRFLPGERTAACTE
jgi:hypothetical protein